jgi:hypothetical protein
MADTESSLIAVGVFLLLLGGARLFVARPEPGEKRTAYGVGDIVGSLILLTVGGVLLLSAVLLALLDDG